MSLYWMWLLIFLLLAIFVKCHFLGERRRESVQKRLILQIVQTVCIGFKSTDTFYAITCILYPSYAAPPVSGGIVVFSPFLGGRAGSVCQVQSLQAYPSSVVRAGTCKVVICGLLFVYSSSLHFRSSFPCRRLLCARSLIHVSGTGFASDSQSLHSS